MTMGSLLHHSFLQLALGWYLYRSTLSCWDQVLEEWHYRSAQANLAQSQLLLETRKNPRDQNSISVMFAESTFLGGKKKSSCSMLHFRKSYPSSQHSLKSQHTDPENICLTSCLLRLACQARHTAPSPRQTQGSRGTTGS